MTELEQLRLQAIALITALRPHDVAVVRAEFTRGGFGSSSMSEGSRASETPIPVSQPVLERNGDGEPVRWGRVGPRDATDREMEKKGNLELQYLREIVRYAILAGSIESYFLVPVPLAEDEQFYPCTNPACHLPPHERKKGECGRCRKWRHDHGLAYPLKRETTSR